MLFYIARRIFKNNYLFALDQFKEELFSTDLLTKLRKKRNKVKIVYCSSINDNKIRLECLKTWKKYNNSNPKKLDVESQNYYFYYFKCSWN